MKKKHIAIAVIIVIVWACIIGFFIIKSKEKEVKSSESIKRYVIPEEKKTFLNGTVQPNKSKVFFKDATKGENYTINKNDGEMVSKGSLLITYKNEEVSNQISGLEEQISELKKEKNKANNGKDQVNETQIVEIQQEMANPIEAEIKNAQKELAKLKKQKYSYEYAPFAGIVCISNQDSGTENQSLLKLRSSDLHVKSQVSERELDKVKKDQPVEVLILANDKTVKGKIEEVSHEPEDQVSTMGESTAGASSIANYPVIIDLDSQSNIVNGYHVQAKIKSIDKEIKIPTSAIKSEKNKKYVYLIRDDKLEKQFIKTKGTKGEFTIVTSGLKEKDEIVEVVKDDMKEGQSVE
ncbi:MAG: efflux RND transporter periplasmic adaptor subunit [Terrisporobacter sp.]